ncbi:hypothetical protein [Microbispora sp. H10836]|uniref:hypothetical protein n=1 Tax=Microbispora sp. H10836 TaxID=2729106 RepID=UPI0014753A22|nr:hypothetical protein [Microbispora sp. H10836]
MSPGPLDTKARREVFPDLWEERLVAQMEANPSGRGVTTDDVAGVVEAMAKPEFAMVQGQVLLWPTTLGWPMTDPHLLAEWTFREGGTVTAGRRRQS